MYITILKSPIQPHSIYMVILCMLVTNLFVSCPYDSLPCKCRDNFSLSDMLTIQSRPLCYVLFKEHGTTLHCPGPELNQDSWHSWKTLYQLSYFASRLNLTFTADPIQAGLKPAIFVLQSACSMSWSYPIAV